MPNSSDRRKRQREDHAAPPFEDHHGGRGQDGRGGKSGRRPVAVGLGDQRLRGNQQEDRQRHGEQQAPPVAVDARRSRPTAASAKAANGTGPMMATCVPRKASRPRMFGKAAVPVGVVAGVLEGRELMLGIPDQVGRDQQERDRRARPGAGMLQRRARLRRDDGIDRIAERQIDHRVFGVEAEADRHAERHARGERRPLDMMDDAPAGRSTRTAAAARRSTSASPKSTCPA